MTTLLSTTSSPWIDVITDTSTEFAATRIWGTLRSLCADRRTVSSSSPNPSTRTKVLRSPSTIDPPATERHPVVESESVCTYPIKRFSVVSKKTFPESTSMVGSDGP